MVHWRGLSFWLPVGFQQQAGGCKAVLRINQGSSQTLHPFSLVPSHICQRGQLAVLGSEEGSRAEECFWLSPHQIWRARKRYHSHGYLVALHLHLSSFLAWMGTSAGYCSQGTAWTGQVGTSHISQTRKILLMCMPPFPGILDKYFSKVGNLADEALPITQTAKKTWTIVYLIESNQSV